MTVISLKFCYALSQRGKDPCTLDLATFTEVMNNCLFHLQIVSRKNRIIYCHKPG